MRNDAASMGLGCISPAAGAHIATLLGVDERYLAAHDIEAGRLAGVIGIATPVSFGPFRDAYWAPLFGEGERFRRSQPASHLDGTEPPFLLLHGARDRVVSSSAAEQFAATLRKNGVDAEAKIYPNIGHARILAALAGQHSSIAPVLRDIEAFVEQRERAARENGADATRQSDTPAATTVPSSARPARRLAG